MISLHIADTSVNVLLLNTPQINPISICSLFPDGTLTNKKVYLPYFTNVEHLLKTVGTSTYTSKHLTAFCEHGKNFSRMMEIITGKL